MLCNITRCLSVISLHATSTGISPDATAVSSRCVTAFAEAVCVILLLAVLVAFLVAVLLDERAKYICIWMHICAHARILATAYIYMLSVLVQQAGYVTTCAASNKCATCVHPMCAHMNGWYR
jgi:hypothetical protein